MRPRPPAVLVLATLLAGCAVEAAGDPPVSSTPAGAPLRVEVVPATEGSGGHGGCRLRFDVRGALLVGTGDTTRGSAPQDLGSLAGKVLRVDAATGRPAEGNPFTRRAEPAAVFVWTYGHRN